MAWLLAVVTAATAGVLAGRAALTPPSAAPEAAPVPTYTVVEASVGRTSTFRAHASWPTRDLAFADAEGTVTSVDTSTGEDVDAGTVLYHVDLRPVVIARGEVPAFRGLAEGVTGPDVRQLQEFLHDLGHYRGRSDGVFGARTATAVRAWQRSLEVPMTGVVEPGDLVFAPTMPARVLLTDHVAVGRRLTTDLVTVRVVTGAPDVTITVGGNSEPPAAGARVHVSHRDQTWDGVVGDAARSLDDDGATVLRLVAEDGGPICADRCAALADTEADGELSAQVETVAAATGTVVPVSALSQDATGSLFVRSADGTRRAVAVIVTDGSRAVVSGPDVGDVILLFPGDQDGTSPSHVPTQSGASG